MQRKVLKLTAPLSFGERAGVRGIMKLVEWRIV
jgi:hypothetical protein